MTGYEKGVGFTVSPFSHPFDSDFYEFLYEDSSRVRFATKDFLQLKFIKRSIQIFKEKFTKIQEQDDNWFGSNWSLLKNQKA